MRIDTLVLPFILAVCFCGVFCLVPLAMYLQWLAIATRRDHPTLIAGHWDFAVLLLGLSGFIIAGGALVLTLLQPNFRYWMYGNREGLRAAWGHERDAWLLLSLGYLILVLGIAILTLLARKRTLVIYNVQPAVFEMVITEVFDHLGRPLERVGRVWISGVPLFELDTFDRGHTVTLHWVSNDQRLFEETTRQLRAALATQAITDNPASRWLQTAAWGLGFIAAASCGLLVYGMSLIR